MRSSVLPPTLLSGLASIVLATGAARAEPDPDRARESTTLAPTAPPDTRVIAAPKASPPPGTTPHFGLQVAHRHAFVGRSISHDAVAGTVEVRVAPMMAFGLSGSLYSPFNQDYAASPVAFPLSETLGTYDLDVMVFPLAGHDREKELYLLGGVGGVFSRPVSLVDPVHRKFEFEHRIAFTLGVGGRVALTRWVSAFAEARCTTYVEQRENAVVAAAEDAANRSTWYGDKPLVPMLQTQMGLVFLLPR